MAKAKANPGRGEHRGICALCGAWSIWAKDHKLCGSCAADRDGQEWAPEDFADDDWYMPPDPPTEMLGWVVRAVTLKARDFFELVNRLGHPAKAEKIEGNGYEV